MERRRQILAAGALVAASLLIAVLLVATAPSEEQRPPDDSLRSVRVLEVRPQTVRLRVVSQGTVQPRVQSELIPEISGRVEWVSPALAAGGFFAADEELVRIDPSDYQTALRRARARVIRARSEHAHAKRTLERRENLSSHEFVSAAQREDAERGERVAYAELEEARAAHEEAERNLRRTHISAPFVGRVRDERIDVGQFVERGEAIATLYAIDQAEVRLPVPDRELAYLAVPLGGPGALASGEGPAVTLTAEFGGATHRWSGRIVRVEGEIDPRTRVVHVVARVDDPYGLEHSAAAPLAVGLFVQAEIAGRVRPGVSVIPRAALRGADGVLVVDAEDRLQRRQVDVMRVERERALIGAGLAAGERVCVSDVPVFVEGMQVRPVPVEAGDG